MIRASKRGLRGLVRMAVLAGASLDLAESKNE